jgi:DNA (cytosine-5)-methyltransferase 1
MKALSLFANIGVAEAYLNEIGIEVTVANELVERRAQLYSKIYPEATMIAGDIMSDVVFKEIINVSKKKKIEIVMATPPCQGMSTAGQQQIDDTRNYLILPVIEIVKELHPKYVFLENVPNFLNTDIEIDGERVLIPNLIRKELERDYVINVYTVNTQDYCVPQLRERAIFLLTRKDQKHEWVLPEKEAVIVTMRDAIGDLPSIDPYIKDATEVERQEIFPEYERRKKAALEISHWNIPPHHVKRQVIAMQHTPTGCTAFDNSIYYPIKDDGTPVKGYRNTYKRQNWDTAAYTVTMDNRKISSQNNVHPGRLIGKDNEGREIYSDPRTLTLYELMIIMSLPTDWPVPKSTSEAFLRRIIGEGIPPLFVKKVFINIFSKE